MTYKDIKQMYSFRNYTFRKNELELNLFGIRSKDSQSNKFDDLIGCVWIENGQENIRVFKGTTDPGKYWLLNPFKKEGCIIMVPGQYIHCYAKGLHANKYDAFKQIRPMMYVRDGNLDATLDFDLYRNPEKRKRYAFFDICGTNLHRASQSKLAQWIEQYSAGCQVVQNIEHFNDLIALRDRSILKGYKTFDYTLFENI